MGTRLRIDGAMDPVTVYVHRPCCVEQLVDSFHGGEANATMILLKNANATQQALAAVFASSGSSSGSTTWGSTTTTTTTTTADLTEGKASYGLFGVLSQVPEAKKAKVEK